MSLDVDALAEALAEWKRHAIAGRMSIEGMRVMAKAGEAFLEAPTAWFCETHKGTRSTKAALKCATATVWLNGGLKSKHVGECKFGRVRLVAEEET